MFSSDATQAKDRGCPLGLATVTGSRSGRARPSQPPLSLASGERRSASETLTLPGAARTEVRTCFLVGCMHRLDNSTRSVQSQNLLVLAKSVCVTNVDTETLRREKWNLCGAPMSDDDFCFATLSDLAVSFGESWSGKQCLMAMLGLLGLVTLAPGQQRSRSTLRENVSPQCLLLNDSKFGLDCVDPLRLIDLLKLHSRPNTLTWLRTTAKTNV